MKAKIYLAGLLALGGAAVIGCNHQHGDPSMDVQSVDQGGGSGDTGLAKVVGTVDPPAENKAANPVKPAAPPVDHVSTGGDLNKPDAPAAAAEVSKPQPPPAPDAPKPDVPAEPSVKPDAPAKPDTPKPDAPKPDAPAVPEPTVKPDAPAPDTSKPDAAKQDAAKATDADKAAIEKEVGTEDAPKAKDAGK